MTTVRIAHAEPRPGNLGNGSYVTHGYLVVLADDAGHRAVPIWLQGEPGEDALSQFVELAGRPAGEIVTAGAPEEVTVRLLHAVGAGVTGVDIDVTEADADELTPQASVARIRLGGPAGTRHVTAGLGLGLAMAAAADAPVRLPDPLLDRLAVPIPGDDLLSPFLDRVPPAGQALPGHAPTGWPLATLPSQRPRYEPRNMAFTDGLDRWDLDRGFHRETDPPAPDYSAAADGRSGIVSSSVSRPVGSAALVQAIFADDFRGATVVFGGELRTTPRTEQAGLRLEILRHWWRNGRAREDHGVTISGGSDWTRHEVTALIPEDADIVRFGIALTGPGQVALRNPELRTAEPARGA